ncbi:MAG: S-methyl-5-thioribose-1-phosphate isomerase [Planctomycetota bacterium]
MEPVDLSTVGKSPVMTIAWKGELPGELVLLDQTKLPAEEVYLDCRTVEDVFGAIRRLSVRGAPAIGVAAAYGVLVGIQHAKDAELGSAFDATVARLAESRPTAVNLFWALDRMKRTFEATAGDEPSRRKRRLLEEAQTIHEEDRRMCADIGRHGAELLADGHRVLTHCNAGALATGGLGTALSVVYTAARQGKKLSVYADETRPLLQGARLTAWELSRADIPVTVICDGMVGTVMRQGRVDAVIVGADRITARGDVANKIGTYTVSVVAARHGVPFYVAAPVSTFDFDIVNGDDVPIEERSAEEITEGFGSRTAPYGVSTYNPAFDITPAENITAIITERGVIENPSEEKVRSHFSRD